MSSVEMLEIRKVAPKIESSCEILTKIWRIFPNLKHLAVSLIGSLDKNTSRVDWGNMKRFFRNLHQCPSNVSRLTFHVEITSSFSELMEAMDVSEGLDGVQAKSSVKVVNRAFKMSLYPDDHLCTKFENVFKTWQPNLSFHGFEFKVGAVIRMLEFIKENNLQVAFVDKIDPKLSHGTGQSRPVPTGRGTGLGTGQDFSSRRISGRDEVIPSRSIAVGTGRPELQYFSQNSLPLLAK
ncbi:Prolipoprotein diacylglyceryl transferase [Folsomia candida]|uniref:Prolipoprotein diacylglyceryl transferase n=1 Tax=Folsomia candida TaxID=158441 RepID=A0A226D6A8_FOLCA|nr:Prolipoprotein diacylglyceryl transferase [Folsomia candida]